MERGLQRTLRPHKEGVNYSEDSLAQRSSEKTYNGERNVAREKEFMDQVCCKGFRDTLEHAKTAINNEPGESVNSLWWKLHRIQGEIEYVTNSSQVQSNQELPVQVPPTLLKDMEDSNKLINNNQNLSQIEALQEYQAIQKRLFDQFYLKRFGLDSTQTDKSLPADDSCDISGPQTSEGVSSSEYSSEEPVPPQDSGSQAERSASDPLARRKNINRLVTALVERKPSGPGQRKSPISPDISQHFSRSNAKGVVLNDVELCYAEYLLDKMETLESKRKKTRMAIRRSYAYNELSPDQNKNIIERVQNISNTEEAIGMLVKLVEQALNDKNTTRQRTESVDGNQRETNSQDQGSSQEAMPSFVTRSSSPRRYTPELSASQRGLEQELHPVRRNTIRSVKEASNLAGEARHPSERNPEMAFSHREADSNCDRRIKLARQLVDVYIRAYKEFAISSDNRTKISPISDKYTEEFSKGRKLDIIEMCYIDVYIENKSLDDKFTQKKIYKGINTYSDNKSTKSARKKLIDAWKEGDPDLTVGKLIEIVRGKYRAEGTNHFGPRFQGSSSSDRISGTSTPDQSQDRASLTSRERRQGLIKEVDGVIEVFNRINSSSPSVEDGSDLESVREQSGNDSESQRQKDQQASSSANDKVSENIAHSNDQKVTHEKKGKYEETVMDIKRIELGLLKSAIKDIESAIQLNNALEAMMNMDQKKHTNMLELVKGLKEIETFLSNEKNDFNEKNAVISYIKSKINYLDINYDNDLKEYYKLCKLPFTQKNANKTTQSGDQEMQAANRQSPALSITERTPVVIDLPQDNNAVNTYASSLNTSYSENTGRTAQSWSKNGEASHRKPPAPDHMMNIIEISDDENLKSNKKGIEQKYSKYLKELSQGNRKLKLDDAMKEAREKYQLMPDQEGEKQKSMNMLLNDMNRLWDYIYSNSDEFSESVIKDCVVIRYRYLHELYDDSARRICRLADLPFIGDDTDKNRLQVQDEAMAFFRYVSELHNYAPDQDDVSSSNGDISEVGESPESTHFPAGDATQAEAATASLHSERQSLMQPAGPLHPSIDSNHGSIVQSTAALRPEELTLAKESSGSSHPLEGLSVVQNDVASVRPMSIEYPNNENDAISVSSAHVPGVESYTLDKLDRRKRKRQRLDPTDENSGTASKANSEYASTTGTTGEIQLWLDHTHVSEALQTDAMLRQPNLNDNSGQELEDWLRSDLDWEDIDKRVTEPFLKSSDGNAKKIVPFVCMVRSAYYAFSNTKLTKDARDNYLKYAGMAYHRIQSVSKELDSSAQFLLNRTNLTSDINYTSSTSVEILNGIHSRWNDLNETDRDRLFNEYIIGFDFDDLQDLEVACAQSLDKTASRLGPLLPIINSYIESEFNNVFKPYACYAYLEIEGELEGMDVVVRSMFEASGFKASGIRLGGADVAMQESSALSTNAADSVDGNRSGNTNVTTREGPVAFADTAVPVSNTQMHEVEQVSTSPSAIIGTLDNSSTQMPRDGQVSTSSPAGLSQQTFDESYNHGQDLAGVIPNHATAYNNSLDSSHSAVEASNDSSAQERLLEIQTQPLQNGQYYHYNGQHYYYYNRQHFRYHNGQYYPVNQP